MNDSYKEILIKKKKTPADTMGKVGLVAITVLMILAGTLINPILLLLGVAGIFACYFFLPYFDLEYEYIYVNGDIDVDKIMKKQKRKRVGSYPLEQLEIMAPANSHELDPYSGKAKIKDYTSGEENVKAVICVYSGEDAMSEIKLELEQDVIDDIRRRAPRKVSRDLY